MYKDGLAAGAAHCASCTQKLAFIGAVVFVRVHTLEPKQSPTALGRGFAAGPQRQGLMIQGMTRPTKAVRRPFQASGGALLDCRTDAEAWS